MRLLRVGAVIHLLAAKACALSRRIYASFPWGYRVAGVMLHLASGLTSDVGKVLYAAFLKAGVDGMPPVKDVEKAVKNPALLPTGYGKRFAERLYATLLSKVRNPATVEDILGRLMEQVAQGKLEGLKPGSPLIAAEQFVMTMAMRLRSEYIRKEFGRPDRSLKPRMEQLDETIDFEDPDSFKNFGELLPSSEVERLMRDLSKIDTRAPSWLEAKLSGLSNVEIAEEWGVGKSRVTGWEKDHLPAIKKVILRYVEEAAA